MPKIFIDNVPYDVRPGQNLLAVGLEQGLNIPYFCWHPALGSAGACRQCAVKQYANPEDTRGRLVMACMTPCGEGNRFSIEDQEAKDFRAGVVELLMANHPHDCPVCDEGGECHLQDMTVMTGHAYRDYRFKKRTYENQDLGPLINHEMNRCIQCYRCVRYYRDYAGGEDLQAFASKNHVFFGRHQPGTLENEFSGNLVEVCPTGVFTDKTLKKHYTRRWDLTTAPSVCGHCSVGCNTFPGERYGGLRRIRNRYNGEVNGYFLCDRGRYGYEYANAADRIKQTFRRGADGGHLETARTAAIAEAAAWLADPSKVVAIGSPRASLESNFALRRLAGEGNFCVGLARRQRDLHAVLLECLQKGSVPTASLRKIGEAEAVLILGEDLQQSAARIALQVRQASRNLPMAIARKAGIPDWNELAVREIVQDEKGPLILAHPAHGKLDDLATQRLFLAPDEITAFGFALAAALDPAAPAPAGISAELAAAAEKAAETLRGVAKIAVIGGTSLASEQLLRATAAVAWAAKSLGKDASLALVPAEANSMALAFLGGLSLEEVLERLESGAAETLVIDQNDLYRRADRQTIDRLFAAAKHVVVMDHTPNETTRRADLLFPVGTVFEGDGTLINYEGRAQRAVQVYLPAGEQTESWRLVRDLGQALGRQDFGWEKLDDLLDAIEAEVAAFASLDEVAPDASFRIRGLKIPRQSHRASGRTAIKAKENVSEGAVPTDPDSPLSFSMEGYLGAPPPALTPFFWAPGWNSASSITRFQEEIGGPLRGGDPGLRLIEPAEGAAPAYPVAGPPAAGPPAAETNGASPQPGQLLLLPLPHLFGSEELSLRSAGIATLAPSPYLALSPDGAAAMGLLDGAAVLVELEGYPPLEVKLKVAQDFPAGCAGLPHLLPNASFPTLPAWGRVHAAPAAGEAR
jgi:NADH-quinone oxidoreductase subunit G